MLGNDSCFSLENILWEILCDVIHDYQNRTLWMHELICPHLQLAQIFKSWLRIYNMAWIYEKVLVKIFCDFYELDIRKNLNNNTFIRHENLQNVRKIVYIRLLFDEISVVVKNQKCYIRLFSHLENKKRSWDFSFVVLRSLLWIHCRWFLQRNA